MANIKSLGQISNGEIQNLMTKEIQLILSMNFIFTATNEEQKVISVFH